MGCKKIAALRLRLFNFEPLCFLFSRHCTDVGFAPRVYPRGQELGCRGAQSEPGLPGDGTRGLPPLQPLLRGGEEGHVGKREQFVRESQLFVASLQLMSLFLHVGLKELLAWSLWYLLRQRSPEFSFSAAPEAGHSERPARSLSAVRFPTEAVVFWSEIFYTVYFVPSISRS